jgi:hypothetical protein
MLGYVLAVAKSHPVTTGTRPRPAIELARALAARAWQRISAGSGAKGPRWYDWAFIQTADPAVAGRRHSRAHPALQLRRRRRPRQPHQDDQTQMYGRAKPDLLRKRVLLGK